MNFKGKIECYFDGACEPLNPGGHASWGAIVKVDSKTVWSESGYVGFGSSMSNNVAEYAGVTAVLLEAQKHEGIIIVYGDSKLVIQQMSGRWKVKNGLYVPFYLKAKEALMPVVNRTTFRWIPREQNTECDKLSKKRLKDSGVKFSIQPEAA